MEEQLVNGCRKGQRDAQRLVYERLAPRLYHTCRRYLKKEEEIEEALADSFYIIFTKIDQLKENAAFEGWARRIAINECLRYLRKSVNFNLYVDDMKASLQPVTDAATDLEEDDLLQLLTKLPAGCRTVFSLYAIEGYGHKEIAALLDITEGTSKSQLNAARTKLKDLVGGLYYKQAK
ncbi:MULTISPECIES: RNA polymerase sigma factor [unclassified Flavobacterium]|uniref:RNA polymerase sigma factor n=1 Tax=unclassified Flavobacterium TaxID=196869 RepID=UPI001F12F8C4|nr:MULTISPECIES: sigma-70 family RNA polymerase sigma factor [unclassified Flavobacterium]UMY65689.1 sigma-70 family RNA polymerase sigma factor [Flavobacterium sp. HJ-32-4]